MASVEDTIRRFETHPTQGNLNAVWACLKKAHDGGEEAKYAEGQEALARAIRVNLNNAISAFERTPSDSNLDEVYRLSKLSLGDGVEGREIFKKAWKGLGKAIQANVNNAIRDFAADPSTRKFNVSLRLIKLMHGDVDVPSGAPEKAQESLAMAFLNGLIKKLKNSDTSVITRTLRRYHHYPDMLSLDKQLRGVERTVTRMVDKLKDEAEMEFRRRPTSVSYFNMIRIERLCVDLGGTTIRYPPAGCRYVNGMKLIIP